MATEETKLLDDTENVDEQIQQSIVDIPPWNDHRATAYETILEPFHKSLLVFGLLYREPPENGENTSKCKCKCNLGKWYHWLVVTLLCVNFLRYMGAYELGEAYGLRVSIKIVIHAQFFWGAAGAATAHILLDIRPKLFKKWNDYLVNHNIKQSEDLYRMRKRRVTVATAICWIVFCFFGGCLFDMDFNPHLQYLMRVMLQPLMDPCDKSPTFLPEVAAIISIVNLLNISAVVFQVSYLMLMATGITDEFTYFNKQFKSQLKASPQGRVYFASDLEDWRQRHMELVGLVSMIDAAFGLYILIIFVSNVPVSSVLIHRILLTCIYHYEEARFMGVFVQLLIYLSMTFSVIMMLSSVGSSLSAEALLCKGYMYSLELSGPEWTTQRSLQYITFSSKLSEAHIGLTGWKLFQINKGNAKAMLLMIITYTFVLLRFCSSSSAPFHCGQYHPPPVNITTEEELLFDY